MKQALILCLWIPALFAQTFLGAIKEDFAATPLSSLEEKIVEHALLKDSYLSVGESHLEAKTAGLLNYRFIDKYISNSLQESVFCSETIDSFLKTYLEAIEEKTAKTKLFPGNSPYKTNFANCPGAGDQRVTYSGFFHQYPFARNFPQEFVPTPVITEKGNNILAQMKGLKGMFITQMEMEYLEFSATKALLLSKLDPGEFRKKAAGLSLKVDALQRQMELALDNGNPYTSKAAVVLKGSQFDVNLFGENNYFVLTNLEYRQQVPGLNALKRLAALPDQKLNAFLDLLKKNRPYIANVLIGPDARGHMGSVTFPGISRVFEGGTLFIQLKIGGENVLYAFERSADAFICFDVTRDQKRQCF